MHIPRNQILIYGIMTTLLVPAKVQAASSSALFLHVAPDGDDRQAGTVTAPLRSLGGARDRVRQVKREGKPITVRFAAGAYRFAQPVLFGTEDAGAAQQPIVYRAEPDAVVRFTGGVTVRDWQAVSEGSVLARLAPNARSHHRF